MPLDPFALVGSEWLRLREAYVFYNGSWQRIKDAYGFFNGVWEIIRFGSMFFVYVAGSRGVFKINPEGNRTRTIFSDETEAVAVDPDECVYVAQDSSYVVRKFDSKGNQVWECYTSSAPESVAVGPDRYVYSAGGGSETNSRLYKISPNGAIVWTVTGANSVAVDVNNNIFVAGHSGLKKINQNGGVVWRSSQEIWMRTISADKDGYSYCGDASGKVYKFNPSGGRVWVFNSGHDHSIRCVAVDPDKYVYSSDSLGFVKKISPNGSQVWSYAMNVSVRGVAVDPQRFVLACTQRETVKLTANGMLVWSFPGIGGFGIAVDPGVYGAFPDNWVVEE